MIKMVLLFLSDGKLYERNFTKGWRLKGSFFSEDPFDREIKAVFTSANSIDEEYTHTVFIIDSEDRIWSKGWVNNITALGRSEVSIETFGEVFVAERFDMIACGSNFTVAIDVNGDLWLCGYMYHLLPRLLTKHGKNFEKISSGVRFVDVSAGHKFFVAIDDQGNIWGQGSNGSHVLGVEATFVKELSLLCSGNFVAVACGNNHTLCLDEDGDVWCCGKNKKGELGFADVLEVPIFTKMSVGAEVVAISASLGYSLCLLKNGHLYACGQGPNLQGNPSYRSGRFNQIQIDGNQNFRQVYASRRTMMIKDENEQLWISGNNIYNNFIKVETDEPLYSNVSLANRTIRQRLRYTRTKSARSPHTTTKMSI